MRFLARLLLSLVLAFAPVVADAQFTLLGVGGPRGTAAVAYDPGGVLFWQEAGATYIGAGNLNGGTDTRHGIIAFRRMIWLGTPTVQGPQGNFRSSANFGTYGNGAAGCTLEGCTGWMINADAASWSVDGVGFTLRNTLAAADGTPPNPGTAVQDYNYAFDFKWQSVVQVYNTNAAAGSRKVATWLDGVLQTSPNYTLTDTGIAFDVNWNTTRGLCISYCNHGSGLATGGALMLSDVIVDTTNSLGTCDPATPGSAACQAIVDAFYRSSAPVSPGTTSSNCDLFRASYGGASQVDMCLRGPKGSFLNNSDGTAHAMSVANGVSGTPRTTGNGGSVLYNAPYGQGAEPTDRPYRAWVAPLSANTTTTVSVTGSTSAGVTGNVMGNFGGDIKTGDRLFLAWLNCPTGTTAPSVVTPTISSGWTAVASSTNTNPTVDQGSATRCWWALWTHVATNNYVAVNVPWQTGNAFVDPPTVTYGTNAAAPYVYWVMMDYRSSNGTVNIDASDFININQNGAANANLVIPSITTTKATTTLMTLCMTRATTRPTNPPASADLATVQQYSVSATPIITVADEKLTSAGATGTRTYFTTATPATTERAGCATVAMANN